MILKCYNCGNFALSPPRSLGERCNKNGCMGSLSFYAHSISTGSATMVKCDKCGNVYKLGGKRQIFSVCGVNGCDGRLDRYWG